MAYIAPNSTVWLYKGVPLDPNYENTYWFPDKATQKAQFDNSYLAHTFTAQSYCRATGNAIRVQINPDSIINCNYMAFRNTSFGNKIFYAFIDEVAYINNSTAEVRFTIDVLQTYFRDVIFMPSYIEREHSATDEIGDNIVPEPSIGSPKIVVNNRGDGGLVEGMSNFYLVLYTNGTLLSDPALGRYFTVSTWRTDKTGQRPFYGEVNIIDCDIACQSSGNLQKLNEMLMDFLSTPGGLTYNTFKVDPAIVDMFFVPKACVTVTGLGTNHPFLATNHVEFARHNITKPKITKSDSLDGYFPKNKKLYTSPYCYFRLTTNSSGFIDYPYEMITGSDINFSFNGYAEGTSGVVVGGVTNYKSSKDVIDQTLTIEYNQHISTPFGSDNYMTRASEKGIALGLNLGSTALSLNSKLINLTDSFRRARSKKKKKDDPELEYPESFSLGQSTLSAQGSKPSIANPDVIQNMGLSNFYMLRMSYDKATLMQYDSYFTRYGYAVNQVKFPNFIQDKGRKTFNYIKTNGASIAAKDAPADAVEKMKQIFDSGTTVWLQLGNVGNFGLSNDPIK